MATNAELWDQAIQPRLDNFTRDVQNLNARKADLQAEAAELAPHTANADVQQAHTRVTEQITRIDTSISEATSRQSELSTRLYANLTADEKAFIDGLASRQCVQMCASANVPVATIKARHDAVSGMGLGASCQTRVLTAIISNP